LPWEGLKCHDVLIGGGGIALRKKVKSLSQREYTSPQRGESPSQRKTGKQPKEGEDYLEEGGGLSRLANFKKLFETDT